MTGWADGPAVHPYLWIPPAQQCCGLTPPKEDREPSRDTLQTALLPSEHSNAMEPKKQNETRNPNPPLPYSIQSGWRRKSTVGTCSRPRKMIIP